MRAVVGDAIFATDEQTMESVVLDLLRERGLSLAVAESVTGGLVGARLTAVPGASDIFRGAVVSYASEVKFDVLGVPRDPWSPPTPRRRWPSGCGSGSALTLASPPPASPDRRSRRGHPPGTVFLGLALGERAEALRCAFREIDAACASTR